MAESKIDTMARAVLLYSRGPWFVLYFLTKLNTIVNNALYNDTAFPNVKISFLKVSFIYF